MKNQKKLKEHKLASLKFNLILVTVFTLSTYSGSGHAASSFLRLVRGSPKAVPTKPTTNKLIESQQAANRNLLLAGLKEFHRGNEKGLQSTNPICRQSSSSSSLTQPIFPSKTERMVLSTVGINDLEKIKEIALRIKAKRQDESKRPKEPEVTQFLANQVDPSYKPMVSTYELMALEGQCKPANTMFFIDFQALPDSEGLMVFLGNHDLKFQDPRPKQKYGKSESASLTMGEYIYQYMEKNQEIKCAFFATQDNEKHDAIRNVLSKSHNKLNPKNKIVDAEKPDATPQGQRFVRAFNIAGPVHSANL
jgi:hypothetical protein